MLAKCLNFRNKVLESQNAIDTCIEFAMDDLGNTLDIHASARGMEAWEVSQALRKAYGLPSADIVYDYHDTLQKANKTALAELESLSARQAEILRELSTRERDFPS